MVMTLLTRPKKTVGTNSLDSRELDRIAQQHYGKKFNELCSDRQIIIKKLYATGDF